MKKFFLMLVSLLVLTVSMPAATPKLHDLNGMKYSLTDRQCAGFRQMLQSAILEAECGSGKNVQTLRSSTDAEGNVWRIQLLMDPKPLNELLSFIGMNDNNFNPSFDDLPYYCVNYILSKTDKATGKYTGLSFMLCWPSYYIWNQIFEYEGETDSQGQIPVELRNYDPVSLEDLCNNPSYCRTFKEANVIGGQVDSDKSCWEYFSILWNEKYDMYSVVDDKQGFTSFYDGKPSTIVFSAFDPENDTVSVDQTIYFAPEDGSKIVEISNSLSVGAHVEGFPVDSETVDFYVVGDNVNGNCWSLASPDAAFKKIGDGIYEWTGKELGTGFKINDGTWYDAGKNFGSDGTGLSVGEKYTLSVGPESSNIWFNDCRLVRNPKIILNVNEHSMVVTGEMEGMFGKEWFFTGSFNQWCLDDTSKMTSVEGENNIFEIKNVELPGYTEFCIASADWGIVYGSEVDNPVAVSEDNLSVVLEQVKVGNYPCILSGTYDIIWDSDNARIIFAKSGSGPIVNPDDDSYRLTIHTLNGPSMSTSVRKATKAALSFGLDEYWRVERLLFNGMDYSEFVSDNTFVTPDLLCNSTVDVEIGYIGELDIVDVYTGVASFEGSNIKIRVTDGAIQIEGTEEGDCIVVYSVTGQTVTTAVAKSSYTRISLEKGCVYVVRIGDKAVKVIL